MENKILALLSFFILKPRLRVFTQSVAQNDTYGVILNEVKDLILKLSRYCPSSLLDFPAATFHTARSRR